MESTIPPVIIVTKMARIGEALQTILKPWWGLLTRPFDALILCFMPHIIFFWFLLLQVQAEATGFVLDLVITTIEGDATETTITMVWNVTSNGG